MSIYSCSTHVLVVDTLALSTAGTWQGLASFATFPSFLVLTCLLVLLTFTAQHEIQGTHCDADPPDLFRGYVKGL
jgi:hypothetical protein